LPEAAASAKLLTRSSAQKVTKHEKNHSSRSFDMLGMVSY